MGIAMHLNLAVWTRRPELFLLAQALILGDRVVPMQRGYNTAADLRALVARASPAIAGCSQTEVAYFEYDHL